MRSTFLYLLIWTLVGLSLQAEAASGKSSAKKTVEEDLKLEAGDEEGNEVKSLKAELMIQKSEDQALKQLEKLKRKYKGTAMEAGLYFREAELYMRKAKSARFFEVHRDDDKVVRFMPEAFKTGNSRKWIEKSVSIYDLIEKKFVHFRDMDLVLFNNAFAHQSLGKDAQAIKIYNRVINDYSNSPLVPDCHLAVGEFLFQTQKFSAAYEEFKKIRKFPDARVYPYGIYKEAWALYNLGEGSKALSDLEEVISYARENASIQDASRLDLSREALTDMVLFFEDVKSPGQAISYFRKQAGDDQVGPLILKLAQLYQRHGKLQSLEVVYLDLIKTLPLVSERPTIHRELMDAFSVRKDFDSALKHLVQLSDIMNPKSEWAQAQKAEALKKGLEILISASEHYSAKWHKEFRKDKTENKAFGVWAQGAYEVGLEWIKNLPQGPKFGFSFAEILFEREEFRKASTQYFEVAPRLSDLKLRHDASYGAVVSLEKATKDKWNDEDEKQFQKLADGYVKLNPKGPYVTDVRFKQAFIAYEKGRYDQAAPQLRKLAMEFSETERGQKAAHLYLDILNLQKNYEKLKDESLAFAKNLKGLKPATREEFLKIHEEAYYSFIQSKEEPDLYVKFANDLPQSKLADKALFNGARLYLNDKEYEKALQSFEKLVASYPETNHRLEALQNLVAIYEERAELGLASQALLRMADGEKNSEVQIKLWLQAGDYKALNSDFAEAQKLYQKVVAVSPKSVWGQSALERQAQILENLASGAEKIYRQMVDLDVQPLASYGMFKLAQAAWLKGDEEQAFSLSKKVIGMRSESKVNRWALAQARLLQGLILESEFDHAGLKVSKPERLPLVLNIKAEKLSNAQKAFQDVIKYEDKPTAVQALKKLSGLYSRFSQAVADLQFPSEWPAEDVKKLKAELENISMPMEEKGVETLQAAIKVAKDMEMRDDTLEDLYIELDKLNHKSLRPKLSISLAPLPQTKQRDKCELLCLAAKAQRIRENSRAKWLLEKSLKSGEKSADAHYLSALIYWDEKQYAHAVEDLEKVIQKDKGHFSARMALGKIYLRDKEFGKARLHLEAAFAQNPKDKEIQKVMADLDELSGQNRKTAEAKP